MQKKNKFKTELSPVHFPENVPIIVHDQPDHPSREILMLHRHDFLELGWCISGRGIFIVEGKIMYFQTGDITLIGPMESHLAASTPGTQSHWRWYYFDFPRLLHNRFPELRTDFLDRLYGQNFNNVLPGEKFQELQKELEALKAGESAAEKTARAVILLLRLQERFEHFVPPKRMEPAGNWTGVEQAITFFNLHFQKKLTISVIARQCGMSENNFRRVFLRRTGISPLEYLNRVRIFRAQTLLLGKHIPIGRIAEECGFYALSNFNRQFQKITGCSPREFRNNPRRNF